MEYEIGVQSGDFITQRKKEQKKKEKKNKLPLRIIILTHRIVGHFTLGLAVVEKKTTEITVLLEIET